ncbi:Gfo/Idh/MocA family oxidoreductase [Roseinatronobacter sp. S2]|nr:Gfo/Idh/MocA family oxidoreductase [Roseinatronobacter sp. S2]
MALPQALAHLTVERDFDAALARLEPDMVAIATYADSHAALAIAALNAGAHVFVEKPLATNIADCYAVAQAARQTGRKLMVVHILCHHPTWVALIAAVRAFGGPYVFRLNLNQRSVGPAWATHKALMRSASSLVDCGVHYVDVMCQITDAPPVEVLGMGLRLTNEIADDMYKYGHFQVTFADGSCGWYEAGWGPMMSDIARFIKDVISTNYPILDMTLELMHVVERGIFRLASMPCYLRKTVFKSCPRNHLSNTYQILAPRNRGAFRCVQAVSALWKHAGQVDLPLNFDLPRDFSTIWN